MITCEKKILRTIIFTGNVHAQNHLIESHKNEESTPQCSSHVKETRPPYLSSCSFSLLQAPPASVVRYASLSSLAQDLLSRAVRINSLVPPALALRYASLSPLAHDYL